MTPSRGGMHGRPIQLATYLDGRVRVCCGDITRAEADAVVNAANSSLLGGGGVDGAIHRAGGPEILAECREIRRHRYPDGLPTGEAVSTTGGRLHAAHVIHTVGPIFGSSPDPEALLQRAYTRSIAEARRLGARSVAFPAISTGVYGFPKDLAARLVCRLLVKEVALPDTPVVMLVFFSESDAQLFIGEAAHVAELARD